ncbi:hypothetical protein BKA82DRAFT_25021 [Pisolithus tinctorius]|uniref:Uncharacterized protein n=1 Tax=Pisolithus tinctorius Marx 270 TaxID=870435 RepID=A0A0C3PD65_PISTI|nr:hypothetical protein BKA82DRAFT_25021 [Pisolithus tinctorius]KIO05714.1 hypothetical protein M404DRAFT_25021 [Pisolithus tinctorius Marx 270]
MVNQEPTVLHAGVEEFNKYFDELPSKAKAKYKDKVNDLVECKIWINGTAAIVAKFSGGTMY